jgi:TatD DNase family protein
VAFEAQLELAARLDLPVVLHCRDAHADLRDVLRKWVPRAQKRRTGAAILGVLHAYSGDLEMAEEAFGWNMVLSFGGPLTFRNAKALHALLGQLPLDRLMLETDAPYLTPHPYRGKRNEPAYIALIAQGLAEIKRLDVALVADATSALAKAVFAKLALDGHN